MMGHVWNWGHLMMLVGLWLMFVGFVASKR